MPALGLLGIGGVAAIVGLFAILVLWAFHIPLRVLTDILSKVPFVGASLASAALNWTATVMKKWNASFDRLVGIHASWLWGLVVPLPWIFNHISEALRDAKTTANRAHDHAVIAQNNAEAYAFNSVAALQQEMAAQDFLLQQAIAGNYNGILQQVNPVLAEQSVEIRNLQIEQANILSQVASLTMPDITGLQDRVESEIANALGTAEAFAGQGDAVLQGEIAGLQGLVQGLPAEITGVIDNVVPGLIASALAAAGVAAIPGLLSEVGVLEAEAVECLRPLCDTVTPNAGRLGNLGNLFKNLELLGIEALLIALAAECLTNPGAVVDDVEAVVNIVGGPVLAGYRDLIGA